MADTIKERCKDLYDIIDSEMINNAYFAKKLFADKEAKQANSLFYQRIKGKSSITDEELIELYKIFQEEWVRLADKITGIADFISELENERMVKSWLSNKIKSEGLNKEEIEKLKKMVEKEFGKG